MKDVLTSITALAVSVFRQRDAVGQRYDPFFIDEAILQEMRNLSSISESSREEIAEALPNILTESEFSSILTIEGQLNPMLLTAGGGMRMGAVDLLTSLFSSATIQNYLLRLPNDEATFVRAVLDNFEELRRAVRGEKVRAYSVAGVAGVSLLEGKQVTTPWGVLRPAHEVRDNHAFMFARPKTTCTLMEERLVPVKFDRAPNPKHKFDQEKQRSSMAKLLFPLACTLSSKDTENPAGLIWTWSTFLLPFQGGFGYSQGMLAPRMQQVTQLDDVIDTIEELSKTIDAVHSPNIDIAVTRLVSSVAHRTDHTDALVDAVMVWENLVGTSTEVTFRVTATLAKMLEPDPSKRRELRETLANVYNIRSRIIHGGVVDQSDVSSAAKIAVAIAIKALREFYQRRPDWMSLSSKERANTILLDE